MKSGITVRGYVSLLRRNTNYRRLWIAQLISGSGDWFYSVAIYDLLLELTGRAEAVALAAILQILPMFLLGPTAGAVSDRISRRQVMIFSDLVRAILVLGMIWIDSADRIWLLYILLGTEIGTAAFFEAGRNAIVPSLVARDDIPTANAIGSTTWSVTVTAGAAIGGVAVAYLGRQTVFLANSASFLVSAWFVYRLIVREAHVAEHRDKPWGEVLGYAPIVEGFRYVARDWRLAALLTLKFGLGILGARVVLVTILGSREFAIDGQASLGMAALFMFQGLGSILGPLIVGRRIANSQSSMRFAVLTGYLAAALGYVLFSRISFLPLAGLCLVLAHGGAALVWVFSTTLLQLNAEDRFRGRVFAADMGMFMVTASVATFLVGHLIDAGVSARTGALGLGIALLLPALLWGLALRRSWATELGSGG